MFDLSTVPDSPGCYLFKDETGTVLYVGKAKNLKKRVSSYFQKNGLDNKTRALVERIRNAEFIATNSEVEALLLENNLIKKLKPKYNIDLKDSRRYAYLEITQDEYPTLQIARKTDKTGEYFGPFVSGLERNDLLLFLRRTFGLRPCQKLPKRACLRAHMGRCPAPCIGKISRDEYGKRVERVRLILKGKTGEVARELEEEMDGKAKTMDYEGALAAKRVLDALKGLRERQYVERAKKYDEDAINYEVRDGVVYLLVFNIYKGALENKQEFVFDYSPGFLEEFIVRFYGENPVPKEVIVPEKIGEAIGTYLSTLRESKITVTVPEKGEKNRLLELAKKNVEISFFRGLAKTEALKEKLGLKNLPRVIECFDVSHLAGTLTVGSMVQFREGMPDKSNYRKFKLRTVEGGDDFGAMGEIVRRRYARLQQENAKMPDLVVVDGGKGQLNAAKDELDRLGLRMPLVSIAKEFEEIFVTGKEEPLRMSTKEPALQFVQEMRDEAHRFAISYNRLLSKKRIRE